eukprot:scaffold110442_cov20-Tisochrysis_lutea.AAC.3
MRSLFCVLLSIGRATEEGRANATQLVIHSIYAHFTALDIRQVRRKSTEPGNHNFQTFFDPMNVSLTGPEVHCNSTSFTPLQAGERGVQCRNGKLGVLQIIEGMKNREVRDSKQF